MKITNNNLKYFDNLIDFNDFLMKTYQHVEGYFQRYGDRESHSLEHTIRVANTCFDLAQHLGATIDVLLVSAIFHDVGRPMEENTGECHAEISAEIASSFLKEHALNEMVHEVVENIRSHRFSKGIQPTTKEGKILKDADALDALGAIGIYRTIIFSLEKGYNLNKAVEHFYEKLFKLSELMHFPLTKQIAEKETKLMHLFVDEITDDMQKSKFITLTDRIKN